MDGAAGAGAGADGVVVATRGVEASEGLAGVDWVLGAGDDCNLVGLPIINRHDVTMLSNY